MIFCFNALHYSISSKVTPVDSSLLLLVRFFSEENHFKFYRSPPPQLCSHLRIILLTQYLSAEVFPQCSNVNERIIVGNKTDLTHLLQIIYRFVTMSDAHLIIVNTQTILKIYNENLKKIHFFNSLLLAVGPPLVPFKKRSSSAPAFLITSR